MKARLILISLLTLTMTLPLWAFDQKKVSENLDFMKVEDGKDLKAERKPTAVEDEPMIIDEPATGFDKNFREHFYGKATDR